MSYLLFASLVGSSGCALIVILRVIPLCKDFEAVDLRERTDLCDGDCTTGTASVGKLRALLQHQCNIKFYNTEATVLPVYNAFTGCPLFKEFCVKF